MNRNQIFFVFEDAGNYKTESLWAIKEQSDYKIDNIPFFINNIAYGDLVGIELDGDELYFDTLIKESGNSTIQLIFLKEDLKQETIGKEFENLDCEWEGSHLPKYISINIPKHVDYNVIKSFLEKGFDEGLWDYKEACISSYHRNKINE